MFARTARSKTIHWLALVVVAAGCSDQGGGADSPSDSFQAGRQEITTTTSALLSFYGEVQTVSESLSQISEWDDAETYVWGTMLKAGAIGSRINHPFVQFHFQTAADVAACGSSSGSDPAYAPASALGLPGSTCVSGWSTKDSAGVVLKDGAALPWQTDIAFYICVSSIQHGFPLYFTNCRVSGSDALWMEEARKVLWFRYHAPAGYRDGPDAAWHTYFGVPGGPFNLTWEDGCLGAFPSSCRASLLSYTADFPLNTIFTIGDATAPSYLTDMPRIVCSAAFGRAGFSPAGIEANCNSGPNDATHSLAGWLHEVYYPNIP